MISLTNLKFFESRERRVGDAAEVRSLFQKYGDSALDILRQRASDRHLSPRHRKHWKRLASKAKSMAH